MSPLSAFADEISPDLNVQIATLQRLEIPGLDLRSIDNTNVLDLTDAQLLEAKVQCDAAGIHFQSIGSPVNKVEYSLENRVQELAKLRRAIHAAHELDISRIRIFTPTAPDEDAELLLEWMAEQRDLAVAEGVVLLHENDARFWGAYPANTGVLFKELGGNHFRAAFDFANTVLIGFRPWDDWFPWIVPYLDTLHIKDAIEDEQKVVAAGEGDGQLVRTLRYLAENGWQGPLTMEPHLAAAGPYGGFSGDRLFEVAVRALRQVLEEAGS